MTAISDLRLMLETLDEPAMLIDGKRIIAANAGAASLFGGSIEGADVRLVLRHPRALEQILAGRPGDVEAAGIGGAGRSWMIAIRAAPDGRLLVRLTDMSAVRAAEKMRVDFVANASHELRTPLATILGYAETIADDTGLAPELQANFGATIRAEAKRMLQIVEDLMSLSRIEAQRFVAPRERIRVAQLVEAAVDNARRLAEARQCEIIAEIDETLPEVPGDQAQLGQLLDNLIANGLRYGCGKAGCVVTVSARAQGDSVVLMVADTGDGIAREHLPRLTERFYRVDAARSRDSGGTGLGLAIVKHIVERHRGMLDIRSTPGKGTEVEVRLPAG